MTPETEARLRSGVKRSFYLTNQDNVREALAEIDRLRAALAQAEAREAVLLKLAEAAVKYSKSFGGGAPYEQLVAAIEAYEGAKP